MLGLGECRVEGGDVNDEGRRGDLPIREGHRGVRGGVEGDGGDGGGVR